MSVKIAIVKKIEKMLGGKDSIDIAIDDSSIADVLSELHKSRVRLELGQNGLIVNFPPKDSNGPITIYRMAVQKKPSANKATKPAKKKADSSSKNSSHSYVVPRIASDVMDLLVDSASYVVQLAGPTQSGKTSLVHYLGQELNRKVFQINCRGDMGSESFIGEKTVVLDEETKQNKIVYMKGLVEQAMIEGLDKDGNEVGQPAILFIDEITACPSHIAHVLNRIFESDDPSRTMVLDQDGGRVIRSHSGMRIIVAGNTSGRGAQQFAEGVYSAQLDALDLSLLHRISACFRMGYSRVIEEKIIQEKVGDDRVSQLVVKFRDSVRGHIKTGKLTTPFSTKNIIDIANLYRVYGTLGKAIYYAIFEHLLPEERAVYNETAVAILGADVLKENVDSDMDYM